MVFVFRPMSAPVFDERLQRAHVNLPKVQIADDRDRVAFRCSSSSPDASLMLVLTDDTDLPASRNRRFGRSP